LETFSALVLEKFEDEIDTVACSLFFVSKNEAITERCRIATDDDLKAKADECIRARQRYPAIYFHNDVHSPQTSPYQQENIKVSNSNSSSRSGQADFNSRIFRRDLNKCVFCDAPALSAAHMIDFKSNNNTDIVGLFEECKISGIQDTPNGVASCGECHYYFDNGKLFINPVTKKIEISKEIDHIPKYADINGRVLTSPSSFGLFPNSPLMKVKYNNEKKKETARNFRLSDKTVQCLDCGKWCKSERGVKQHQKAGGCASYKACAK
jgi:hypothetical protein